MVFNYEQEIIKQIYKIKELIKPGMPIEQVYETYQIYRILVREDQLKKLGLTTLGYMISNNSEEYIKLMKERVNKTCKLTLEEIANYKEK